MKKTLAIILTLALVICMMPANAFAGYGATELTADMVKFNQLSPILYKGNLSLPTVTVSDANADSDYTTKWELKGNSNYTIPSSNLSAGTYILTVTAKDGGKFKEGSVQKELLEADGVEVIDGKVNLEKYGI